MPEKTANLDFKKKPSSFFFSAFDVFARINIVEWRVERCPLAVALRLLTLQFPVDLSVEYISNYKKELYAEWCENKVKTRR